MCKIKLIECSSTVAINTFRFDDGNKIEYSFGRLNTNMEQ